MGKILSGPVPIQIRCSYHRQNNARIWFYKSEHLRKHIACGEQQAAGIGDVADFLLTAVAASERRSFIPGIDRPSRNSIWKVCHSDGFPTHPKDRRNTSFCGGIPCNIKFRTVNFPEYFSEIFQPVFGVSPKDI